jgi:hypothetical protein
MKMSIKSFRKLSLVAVTTGMVIPLMSGTSAFAQSSGFKADARSENWTSGESGARAGTALYNHFHQDNPLPQSRGDVVRTFITNLGHGQSPKAAWSNAAQSSSGQSGGGHSSGSSHGGGHSGGGHSGGGHSGGGHGGGGGKHSGHGGG